jgi:hypothetical protein
MHKRTFLIGSLIFFLGLCCFLTTNNPELRPDDRSAVLKARVEIINVGYHDFSTLRVKVDFAKDRILDQRNLTVKYDTKTTKSKPISDQTFFKEKRNETLDRCRETAIFPFSAIFLGSLQNPITLVRHLAFVKYSSWSGNSIKIRPPPIL